MQHDSDRNLDRLFQSLAGDAPAPHAGELVELLASDRTTPEPVDGISNTTQRKKGRHIMISSIILALATAVLYMFGGTNLVSHSLLTSVTPNGQQVASTSAAVTQVAQPEARRARSVARTDTTAAGTSHILRPIDGERTAHYCKPDISATSVVTLSDGDLLRLGVKLDTDSVISLLGEDDVMKVTFTTDGRHGLRRMSEEERKIKKSLPWELFPRFITDVRGDLFLIAEHKQTGPDGFTSNFEFVRDFVPRDPNKQYERNEWMRLWGGYLDSSTNPITLVEHARITVGIRSVDTIIRSPYHDEQAKYASIRDIWNSLAVLDSNLKLALGGADGLKARFTLDRTNASDAIERNIFVRFDSIAALGLDPMATVRLQYGVVTGIIQAPEYADSTKLKAEQVRKVLSCRLAALDQAKKQKDITDINSCVPILVRRPTAVGDDGADNGLIVWFKPTTDLFTAVPRLRTTLSETVASTPSPQAPDLSVYPNPASVYLFGDIRLPGDRSATIELRDLLGHSVLAPLHISSGSTDSQAIQFDVSNLPTGIYMLVATTSRTEQLVRRIVVQRP